MPSLPLKFVCKYHIVYTPKYRRNRCKIIYNQY